MRRSIPWTLLMGSLGVWLPMPAIAQTCPSNVPVQGAAVPAPLPVFPHDNWWNADIRSAPVDPASARYIGFIGGTRRLHPDFGGEASPGSGEIYGFPYVIVAGNQPKVAVSFDYWDESDGVDRSTGQGVPFYPIPSQAIGQPHWIEGGAPGNVDSGGDRHLLIIDCSRRYLYELYGVHYQSGQGWSAGSGAFFDLNRNGRRPEGWTSADAAGLAIFPGLVRYDEVASQAINDLGHALRVTVRATNGYVFPASHRAGSTSGALPMGARLRLKSSVNGVDPALRTTDPMARKVFRAMQKYGLIVADNGSDMYISGTFDVRWNNGALNPAFNTLAASDFEVVSLGWKPVSLPGSDGDFNGDGSFDILWRNSGDGRNAIWRSANASTPQAVSTVADPAWRTVGVGDFNGDGRDDILWRHGVSGANAVWPSGNLAGGYMLASVTDLSWQVAGVGDFDGDGRDDMLWRHRHSGANAIWRNGNANTPQPITAVTNLDWIVAAVGDFGNDGHADVLWRNARTGANVIWRSANAQNSQAMPAVTDLSWTVVAVADFGGDGAADILWRHLGSGRNVIWRSGVYVNQQAVAAVPSQGWVVEAAGDYNGDAAADIFWRNRGTGSNVIWRSANANVPQAVAGVSDLRWMVAP